MNGITLPTAPAPTTPTLLTGGQGSSLSQLSIPGSTPSLAGSANFNALSGSVGLNPSGQAVPSYIKPPGVVSTTPPTSRVTGQPVSGFGANTLSPSSSIDSNYFINPGESAAAYQARIASYNAGQTATNGANPIQTSSGATIATNGNGTTSSPTAFNIDTSGVDSGMLGSSYTAGDVASTRQSYADYVNGLSQAEQYSPDYLAAQQAVNQAQIQGEAIKSNFYTGNSSLGDTVDYAQGETAKALQQNSLDQQSAQNQLQIQTLLRQGNIAAAQALVQGTQPQSVSPGSSLVSPTDGSQVYSGLGGYQAVQGIQTVNNLAQTYPDAGILPTDTLATAQQKAAASPSFAAHQTVQVTLPGGGISFINKNQLVPGVNGQTSIISPAQATAADAAQKSITDLTTQKSSIQAALSTVDTNFPILTSIISKYGLNEGIPLQNQIMQKIGGAEGSSAVAQLTAVATGLKATIAQIVSRGGSVDNQTRDEANDLLPTNVSFQTLEDLENVVKSEGQGVLNGYDTSIAEQNATLNGIYSTATPLTSSTGATSTGSGSLYDF